MLGSTAAAAGAIGSEVYAAILGAVVITIIGSSVLVRLVGGSPRAGGGAGGLSRVVSGCPG